MPFYQSFISLIYVKNVWVQCVNLPSNVRVDDDNDVVGDDGDDTHRTKCQVALSGLVIP